MDGIAFNDVPMLVLIADGIGLFAVLTLWLPQHLPFVRGQALVIWSLVLIYTACDLGWRIYAGPPLGFFSFGLLALALYFLWRTWRLRNVA